MESLGSSTLTRALRGRAIAVCLVGLLAAGPAAGQGALALPPVVGASELFHSDAGSGVALGGYDPLTYFLPGGPRPGRPEFELLWSGVAWRFASAANRSAFEHDPWSFAPRIGGHDAEAASRGRVVDASPELFVIRAGRLYLFRNDANRARFLADEGLASRSEDEWRRMVGGLLRQ